MSQERAWQQVDAGRLRFDAPDPWMTAFDVLGALAAARSPHASVDGFHANVTVVEQPAEITDLERLLRMQCTELQALSDALILEATTGEAAGRAATCVLATHRGDDYELTLEQVMLPLDDVVLTISATAATSQYAALAETFDAIFASLAVDARA